MPAPENALSTLPYSVLAVLMPLLAVVLFLFLLDIVLRHTFDVAPLGHMRRPLALALGIMMTFATALYAGHANQPIDWVLLALIVPVTAMTPILFQNCVEEGRSKGKNLRSPRGSTEDA